MKKFLMHILSAVKKGILPSRTVAEPDAPGFTRWDLCERVKPEESVLELGPFANPIFVGDNVKYFDVLTADGLKKRAETIGVEHFPLERIPEKIHFVSTTGDLSIVNEQFDCVVSCHMVEHALDLIDHLKSVERILKENGRYFLIIPDYRYCFDHYQNPSTIAEVIDAHYAKPTRHSLKSVIEHRAMTVHNDPEKHWQGEHGENTVTTECIQRAIEEFHDNDGYIDVHKWYFDSINFPYIITLLRDLGYISFSCVEVHAASKNMQEFVAVLSNAGDDR